MRTVIYIGLIAIADAINKNWTDNTHIAFFTTIFVAAAVMDVVEFSVKIIKKN